MTHDTPSKLLSLDLHNNTGTTAATTCSPLLPLWCCSEIIKKFFKAFVIHHLFSHFVYECFNFIKAMQPFPPHLTRSRAMQGIWQSCIKDVGVVLCKMCILEQALSEWWPTLWENRDSHGREEGGSNPNLVYNEPIRGSYCWGPIMDQHPHHTPMHTFSMLAYSCCTCTWKWAFSEDAWFSNAHKPVGTRVHPIPEK